MNNYNNYSHSNRKIIERIMTVKEFNTDNLNNRVDKNYGFVMPLYHGYDWKKTKKELINKYTY